MLTPGISGHCSLLVTIVPALHRKMSSKFLSFCTANLSFKDTLKKYWEKDVHGCPMFVFATKLRRLKGDLKDLNKRYY